MPVLFISDSRKDIDFVRQLFDRFNARQREAWIDWRGIEYSTKGMRLPIMRLGWPRATPRKTSRL